MYCTQCNADLGNNEAPIEYYVAARRAKDRLFFSVPSLSNANKIVLEKKGKIIE